MERGQGLMGTHMRACFSRLLALCESSHSSSMSAQRCTGSSCTAPFEQHSVPRHPVPPARSLARGTRSASAGQSKAAQCVQLRSPR